MLEQFFNDPEILERKRDSPLGLHLDAFAAHLKSLGYATSTGYGYLTFLADFGHWLRRAGIAIADLDETVTGAFLDERPGDWRSPVLGHLLEFLRQKAIIPHLKEEEIEQTSLALIQHRYERFLRTERGLTPSTVSNYLPYVRQFLLERFGDREVQLGELKASNVQDFILRRAESLSLTEAKLMTTALRSFFRSLSMSGATEADLAVCVPTVANWRLTTIPKYLKQEEIQQVLNSCNRDKPDGRRDYAILLLLVRLGLRAGEVVSLNLEDIDWRGGRITVAGKGLFHDPMPLPPDVGHALSSYLQKGRPVCSSRRVFIRICAPYRGFSNSSAVCCIVRRALDRVDLHPPIKGAHLFRHSLATEMLRRGGSLAEIGEVLRHRALKTTEIYAKVDFDGLRSLAQAWPKSWSRP